MNPKMDTRLAVGLTLALTWLYVGALLSLKIGASLWYVGGAVALWLGFVLAGAALRYRLISASRLTNLSLLTISFLLCMLLLDTTYSAYLSSNVSTAGSADSRQSDENTWIGELYPALYYPSERNFRLHKPNVTVSGSAYGNFYRYPMQKSSTLVNMVLKKNRTTISINDLGFRESMPISDARIFALGDSLTFGWGVNASESWPKLLEGLLGQPVYNLAIYDATPKHELELLKHLLQEQGEKVQIRELLWMIYESNDLKGSYADTHAQGIPSAKRTKTDLTIVDLIGSLPGVIRRQSVIHKIRTGSISWKGLDTSDPDGSYSVDGVTLVHPIFYSDQFGPKLFYGPYVERVGEPDSYVKEHRNRERLEAVFDEMASLAKGFGFNVTVIVAPGASRLHGPYFDNFPKVSVAPHFIDFVNGLARSVGFASVDLHALIMPYAGTELLYFRDDDHFNRRGNELVAELLHKKLSWGQKP